MSDSTVGANAILPDKNKLEVLIDERTVTMRRLGLGDALALAKIVARLGPQAFRPIDKNGTDEEIKERQSEMGMALLMGVFEASEEVLGVIAPVFGVSSADLQDPEQFPLGEFPVLIEALVSHPDIEAVMKNFKSLLNAPAFQQMTNRLGSTQTKRSSSN